MTKRTLKRAFNKFDVIKKTRDPEVPGILGFTINGKNAVEVGNRAGYVWVRLRSNTNEVIQAYNDQVSPVYGLPVVVVRDEIDRTKYKIKGRDLGTYQNWGGSAYLPRHGNQHSFNPEAGGGGDVVFVFSRQFMPLALQPSGTSGAGCVLVQPYAYYQGTTWKYAGGTGTASFLPYKPTGSNARMVLVYLDNDSNPQLLGGSDYFAASITGNAAVLPYVPAIPDTSDIPLGAVRLVSGTSAILWDNIYDLRPIIVSDGFIPTGTASKHEIQDDGTPLTDRAALNFVGSGFSVYNTAGATNVSGTASGGSTTNNYYSTPNTITVLDDHVFKVSGTAIDFTDNISVAVTGSVAFISSTGGGGGGGSNVLPIQDSGAFVVTGTALSFDGDLLASAVGTVGHVSIPAGTFASGSHTHPVGAAAVQIFDNSVFKTTGTAISFDTNLTVAVTGTVAFVNSAGGDLPWFNVLDYGATNGGESTVAFANAIADLNAAGRGVLYVPAGSYFASGSFQISVPFLVRGDGSTIYNKNQYVSEVVCTQAGVTLFTVLSHVGKFVDIALTCSATATAGAGISVSGSYLAPRIDYDNVAVRGFYDDIDIQVGHQWSMRGCYIADPIRYGVYIRNIVNVDAGDWSIEGCGIYTGNNNATSAIRIESSGGGKISNTKINAEDTTYRFGNGIDINRSSGADTSVLLLTNVSIENYSGVGINIVTSGGAGYSFIGINNIQFGSYNNTDDYAININAGTLGDIAGVSIDNCIFRAFSASSVEAISLTKVDRAFINKSNINYGFTNLLVHSGCTNLYIEELNTYTDSIWNAKGDLVIGSGSSQAGILPVGTTGYVLTADGTQPLGMKWALPSTGSMGGIGGGAIAIYDENMFLVSGTALVFNTDLEVSASGTFAYINSTASGGGSGNKLPVFDDSIFKITGTAISFDSNLSVAVTGTVAFVNASGGSGYTQGARVFNSTNISVASGAGTGTYLTFDSLKYDTDNIHVSGSSRLTCQTAGKYIITGNVYWDTTVTTGYRQLVIFKNHVDAIGSVQVPGASVALSQQIITITDLDIGDYIELRAEHTRGSPLNVAFVANFSPDFMMQRIG